MATTTTIDGRPTTITDQPAPSPPDQPPPRSPWPAVVRGFGVTVGPSLLLDLLSAGSLLALVATWLRRPAHHPLAGPVRLAVLLGAAYPWLYAAVLRPWHLRWGATDAEVRAPLPGDELTPAPGIEATRAVTIAAPAEAVWPWLAQIGQDRGGFYSYEWLENLAGCRMRNADRIHPEWQQRTVGETVLLHPATGLRLARFEPPRVLALANWGAFVVEPIDATHTRLLARSRTARGWGALLYRLSIEIPHFIMERRMLLGLKERAERAWQDQQRADAMTAANGR